MKRWHRIGIIAAGVMAVTGVLTLAVVFRGAAGALRGSREQAAASASAFDELRLDRAAPTGYEMLGSPAQFRDAVPFQGQFYLCAASGLYAYDFQGTLKQRYRSGFELPSTRLVAAAVAVSGAHELFIATEGEGLLAF